VSSFSVQASYISGLSPSRLPPLIETLGQFFASHGVEAYLVGGTVRDALLGRSTSDIDIDIAMRADSNMIGRDLASALRGRLVPLDESRDMVRVVVRSDDGVCFVDLSSMPNGIREDLGRRDFTLDAMALSMADAAAGRPWHNNVIDPYGGLSDLRAGVIRAVSPSAFKQDPARLMRAPRLAARLGFEISVDTARQIRQDARLVATVAPERVRDELLKLLAEPDATASLRRLDELGLLCVVIPELAQAKGVTQPKEHYWDVFDHVVETPGRIEQVVQGRAKAGSLSLGSTPRFDSMAEYFAEEVGDGHSRLTLLKLAGLMHDIAKPATKTVESSGRIRFLGHHIDGADMAARIMKRLRFSGRAVELVRLVVRHHLRPSQMAQGGELPTGRAIYRYYRDTGRAAIDTLYLNLADYLAARGPGLRQHEWSEHCRVIDHILREGAERNGPEPPTPLINGHDIMAALCLSPGPKIGALLDLVREAQAGGEIDTREEAMELVEGNLHLGGSGA
jgi:poly(A) polymerase